MKEKIMTKKVLKILADTAGFAATLDPESIDFSVALEEMKDCAFLLEEGFSDEAVFGVANQTTSGELYDLLKDVAKPAGEVGHSIIVTVEEHISGKFTVNARSVKAAMEMVEDGFNRGDMVIEPAPPTARMMMARDTATGETTKWVDF